MTSEPTQNDDGRAPSIPSEQTPAAAPTEGSTPDAAPPGERKPAARKTPVRKSPAQKTSAQKTSAQKAPAAPKKPSTARAATGSRTTSSSSDSGSSTPSTNRSRTAAASSDAAESIVEPSAARPPAVKRPAAPKKPGTAGQKRTPDPVRSAAAKAAAARRKAAKEAAAREAAEAAALAAAEESSDTGRPDASAAPVVPPLPPMSAEEAAAAFARASAQDAAASSSTATRPETTSDPADTLLEGGATPRPEVETTAAETTAADTTAAETTAADTTAADTNGTESRVAVATDRDPSVADAPIDAEPVDAVPVDAEARDAGTSDADTVAASSGWPGAVEEVQSGAPLADSAPPRTESDARADAGAAMAKESPSSGFLGRLRRALSGRSTISTPAPTPTPTPTVTPASTIDDEREPDGDVIDAPSVTVAVPDALDADAADADVDSSADGASISSALEPGTVDTGGAAAPSDEGVVLSVRGLAKSFGDTHAVDSVDLDVHAGSFYGIVGPNGAGKTTTLSMMTGLLRPDAGTVMVNGIDVWADPAAAKRTIGVLPDRLRVFDRLTGAQLLYYAGTLRGLRGDVVRGRVEDLARAFGLEDAMGRLVSDYSAGMVKKVSLAAAMIHSPRVLILDEPFESVDPVSAAKVVDILRVYVDNGGTVILSSHSMDFIQRVCDDVAIIVEGQVLAAGPVEEVRGPGSLEERFLELAGGRKAAEGMEWLHSFSG